MGRELYLHATACEGYRKDYQIGGFLDDNTNSLDAFPGYPDILGTIDDYRVGKDDVFAVSIANTASKKLCVKKVREKGGRFISLIHPTVRVAPDAVIGEGAVILKDADVGSKAHVGDFAFIQNGAIVGHDVSIGNFVRLDCYVILVGGVEIGNEVNIHTAAIINRGVKVNDNASVGAASFVIRSVAPGITVFGNPAKKL